MNLIGHQTRVVAELCECGCGKVSITVYLGPDVERSEDALIQALHVAADTLATQTAAPPVMRKPH